MSSLPTIIDPFPRDQSAKRVYRVAPGRTLSLAGGAMTFHAGTYVYLPDSIAGPCYNLLEDVRVPKEVKVHIVNFPSRTRAIDTEGSQ